MGTKNNSIKQVITFLQENPFSSETEILKKVWNFDRKKTYYSNKKYADLIRNGVRKGKISRIEKKVVGSSSRFFYYIPK